VTLEAADLSAGFAPTARSEWLRLVEKSLKGRAFETLTSRTADGLEIEPLYTAEDAPEGRLLPRAAPHDAGRPWDIRAPVAAPTATAANGQILEGLAGGASSVLLALDPSGKKGCAAASAEDLAEALDGVLLEAAGVALDAGYLGPDAADWLAGAAKGSPAARLGLHLDPISAFAEQGSSPGPLEAHIACAAETAGRLSTAYPNAGLFLATGRAVHEAGGSEAQELGFMAACWAAYARALETAMSPNPLPLDRIILGVSADADIFVTLAKLRAARLIGERLTRACAPAHTLAPPPQRVEARSSRRMLTRVDPWTNMLRLTHAAFAAAAGGADTIVLHPFTDAIGRPTPFARRQARNIQLVLMEESHLGRVADPAAGAWFVESLTHDLAREGWSVFQAIERQDGAVEALKSGYLAANLEGPRRALLSAAEHRGILGVTLYPNPDERPVEVETPATGIPDTSGDKARHLARLPGEDSRCPPLAPIRVAETLETADGALA
jgi:methylmalonyl-CoA mutase